MHKINSRVSFFILFLHSLRLEIDTALIFANLRLHQAAGNLSLGSNLTGSRDD